jgi:protocatechuate 3,4-dioxygenase alpha subunit
MSLPLTPSQTVGPYFHIGLTYGEKINPLAADISGVRISIEGHVLDGDGNPVNDALIEIWQANAHGRYAHPEDTQSKPLDPGFKGFTRAATDNAGAFRFATIKPGPVPGPNGVLQAPHLAVMVFMRGLLKHLVTRIYFPNEPRNVDDPVLKLVAPERRATLIAQPSGADAHTLRWDVVLQGKNETVFFDY